MATDVEENLDQGTYALVNKEKTVQKLLVTKDKRWPSLYKLEWGTGSQSAAFDERFTNATDCIEAGKKFLDNMKMTQAAKNAYLAEEREKRKTTSGKKLKA